MRWVLTVGMLALAACGTTQLRVAGRSPGTVIIDAPMGEPVQNVLDLATAECARSGGGTATLRDMRQGRSPAVFLPWNIHIFECRAA